MRQDDGLQPNTSSREVPQLRARCRALCLHTPLLSFIREERKLCQATNRPLPASGQKATRLSLYLAADSDDTCFQDDDSNLLMFVTSFLLFDVRETEATAELLNEEGAFTRLVDLISSPLQNEDVNLHRMLMELLYEMSRIQRIKPDDLGASYNP